MSTFEDRLLTELRQHLADRPAPARRPRRGRLVLAGGGALAAIAAALVVALGGGASAYAVEQAGSGAVTVHIRSLGDAGGLQSALRAAGLPAIVEYGAKELPCGGPVQPPPGEIGGFSTSRGSDPSDTGPSTSRVGAPPPADGAANQHQVTGSIARTDDGVVFTIDPGTLKPGEHVYIATTTGTVDSVGMAIC